MDPKRTREALEHFEVATPETFDGQPGVFIAPLNLDESVEVFETASWAVDLFVDCETCEGSGCCYLPTGHLDRTPCPACEGRGYILNRERMASVKRRLPYSALAYASEMEAAILAFLLEGPNSD